MDKLELWRSRKKELGLTNKQIAEKANLPLRTVEQIMCGTVKSPRLDSVEAIERALGINEKSPPATQEGKGIVIPEKYKDVAVAFYGGADDLTQDDIDSIVEFIEFRKNKKKK